VRRAGTLLIALCLACHVQHAAVASEAPRPNVLLLCVDDLRPELGCAGSARAVSPAIDRLAAEGRLFLRHYAVFPTCGASRAAMLTGRLPESWGNDAFRGLREDPVPTLPGVFRAAGYRTVCLGKVSHTHDGRLPDGTPEMPEAWDELPTAPGAWRDARHLLHAYADGAHRIAGESPLWERAEVGDEGYPDGILAAQAVAWLGALAEGGEPFFLAVGFFKPHLPFSAPARYWDLFDPARIDPGPDATCPEGLGDVHACRQSGEVTGNYAHALWDDGRWDAAERRRLIHAYLACVAYVDAQIGKVLDELRRLELDDDTLVVLWGDHGFHLGEQGLMGKHTTFESALRSPLIVRAPGDPRAGARSERLVSSFDLFPTLCELAGLAAPAGLEGTSFAPALRGATPPDTAGVRSHWRAAGHRGTIWRTPRWKLVRWEGAGDELYDLRQNPGETRNVAADHPDVVRRLAEAARVDQTRGHADPDRPRPVGPSGR
jgi:arylsulfatase A-like enzyme